MAEGVAKKKKTRAVVGEGSGVCRAASQPGTTGGASASVLSAPAHAMCLDVVMPAAESNISAAVVEEAEIASTGAASLEARSTHTSGGCFRSSSANNDDGKGAVQDSKAEEPTSNACLSFSLSLNPSSLSLSRFQFLAFVSRAPLSHTRVHTLTAFMHTHSHAHTHSLTRSLTLISPFSLSPFISPSPCMSVSLCISLSLSASICLSLSSSLHSVLPPPFSPPFSPLSPLSHPLSRPPSHPAFPSLSFSRSLPLSHMCTRSHSLSLALLNKLIFFLSLSARSFTSAAPLQTQSAASELASMGKDKHQPFVSMEGDIHERWIRVCTQ